MRPYFPERLQLWLQRIVFVSGLSAFLVGCDAYAGARAQGEATSVRALAQPGVSAESIRTALTRRGYGCSDGSGQFLAEGGSIASAPRFVYCDKNVARTLVCTYRVQVIVVPLKHSAVIHAHPGSACL